MRSLGSVTTPCPLSRPRPTSNWGLTSTTRSPSGREQAGEVAHDEGERDERQVGDDEVGRPAEVVGGQAAHGGAAALVDPRVVGHLGHQLAVADVDRHHPGGAAGQQHLAEAAGRGADVDAAPPGDRQPLRAPVVEGGDELVRGPADPARARRRSRTTSSESARRGATAC